MSYDQSDHWDQAVLSMHIQEPRVGVPLRYTRLVLNNANNCFSMERYREDGVENRILRPDGDNEFTFNGESDIPEKIINKYKLNVERSASYRRNYQVLYGIPMSLTDEILSKISPAESVSYEGNTAYCISLELKEEIISKHWTLIISEDMNKILALEFRYPDQPDQETEILKFNDVITVDGIKIPRLRHWYFKDSNEYLGSDIVVEEFE